MKRSVPPGRGAVPLAVLLAAIAVYVLLVIRTSWISDDAFITLRVVDNTVHGFGARWNVAERVQAFTHPLWFLVLTPVYAFTREAYLTTSAVCWLASFAAVTVLARHFGRRDRLVAAGLIGSLALSGAFVDYSTSGLENPLTHVLLALFVLLALGDQRWDDRRLFTASLLAGLITTNRMDALLFVAPALGWLVWSERRARTFLLVAAGFTPFLGWAIFASLYYGSPWPNTALAKLNTGIPSGELVAQGLRYLADAFRHDPLSPSLVMGGVAAAALRRRPLEISLAGGLMAYVLYVVKVGGDFMAGRFLAAPALVGTILLAQAGLAATRRLRVAAAGIILALSLVGVVPTLTSGQAYASRAMELLRPHGIADERRFYFASAGLFNGAAGWSRPTPSNRSVNKGADLRRVGTALTVEGAVGYVGYFAGPSVHIVDYHALADPLLARLPMVVHDPFYAAFLRRVRPGEIAASWRPGHFMRALPAGYLASLATGENHIADPTIHALWERVVRVSRGPIFSGARFRDIIELLLSRGGLPDVRTPFTPIAWDEILAADPHNGEASFQAALDALEAKQESRGISLLESALIRTPEHERAMVRLAEIDVYRGELERAQNLLAKARSLAPFDPAAAGVAGDLARARGQDEIATGLYLEAARFDPAVAGRMYGNIGILHALRSDWSAALTWFGKAESVSPGDPQTAYNTGSAYARMGRTVDARAAFKRALAVDPRYEPALRALKILSGS